MNWQEKKASLMKYLESFTGSFKISGEESPEILRKKQLLRLSIGGFVALLGASYAIGLFDSTATQPQQPSKKEVEKPMEQSVVKLSTPLSSVKDGDIWVARIEKLVKGLKKTWKELNLRTFFWIKRLIR